MNKRKSSLLFRLTTTFSALAVSIALATPQTIEAVGTTSSSSASTSSSSSASTSSSSSASTSSASSSSARASMSASQQASRSASTNASRSVSNSANRSNVSRSQAVQNQTRSMSPVGKPYSSKASKNQQLMTTNFYNNWLLYYMVINTTQDNHKKSMSVDAQKDMLKKQMKDKETLYTVTVDTKNGERVIAVPKKDYDKIQKGSHIKYNNGKVEIS